MIYPTLPKSPKVKGEIQLSVMLDNSSVLQMSNFICLNIAAYSLITASCRRVNSSRNISGVIWLTNYMCPLEGELDSSPCYCEWID